MKKLLFFVTVDWYFCSHRLPLAIAARAAGFEVVVVTQVQCHGQVIEDAGLRVVHLNCSRRSTNPFSELRVLFGLISIYRREKPDIVHHVAMKPVLYGAIAARVARVPAVVNALTGMGYLFSSGTRFARLLLPPVRLALRVLLRRGRVIVQNSDDAALMRSLGVNSLVVIRGSGVDPQQFAPGPEPAPPVTVMLASRLLWDKGVGEFVEAARLLKARGVPARFVLVGAPDAGNRSSVSEATVEAWESEGIVECWGHRADMPSIVPQAHIACLPSYYREGVPKSLIEAASCGLPIVTTDTPGCREIVVDGENGFLVPPRDAVTVADALQELAEDSVLRRRMGERSRLKVESEFAQNRVIEASLAVYRELAGDPLRPTDSAVHARN